MTLNHQTTGRRKSIFAKPEATTPKPAAKTSVFDRYKPKATGKTQAAPKQESKADSAPEPQESLTGKSRLASLWNKSLKGGNDEVEKLNKGFHTHYSERRKRAKKTIF